MDQIGLWWILNNNEQEIPEVQLEEYALKLGAKDFACRSKQNHNEENLLALHQESFPWKGIGLILNQETFSLRVRGIEESHSSSASFSASTPRRGWSGSFLEKIGKSAESTRTIYSLVWRLMGSMLGVRRRSKKEVPVLYWWFRDKLFVSGLFKDIQDAISLVFHYRTMWWFRADSSNIFTILDVRSIFILSPIQEWYWEDKVRGKDRLFFCLLILWTKVTRIWMRLIWTHRVMHNTCTMHGRDTKTQYIGSTSTLLWRNDWSSFRLDLMQSFSTKHFQLFVFQKLLSWKLENSFSRKVSPPPLPKIFLDEGIGFTSCSTSRSQPTQPTKPNPDNDRTGEDPLFAQKARPEHVSLVTARTPK